MSALGSAAPWVREELELPGPTRDAAQAAKDIEAFGFCIVPDVLPS